MEDKIEEIFPEKTAKDKEMINKKIRLPDQAIQ